MMTEGRIFNIQHFSVNDGPGIRTVVFLKGCPLRCRWCGNPESQHHQCELAWTHDQCLHCGSCVKATKGAIYFSPDGRLHVGDATLTKDDVEDICPTTALHLIGEDVSVDYVLHEVLKDKVFYDNSGGGLTLSGGEPLSQPAFTTALLKGAKDAGLHTAIETTGYAPWPVYQQVATYLDYIFMDIKTMDTVRHKEQTGVDNALILANFKRLVKAFPTKTIHVRTPVIPGFNDTIDAIQDILDFLAPYPHVKYEVLKYHRFGVGKYETLGRPYLIPKDAEISDDFMAKLNELIQQRRGYIYDLVEG